MLKAPLQSATGNHLLETPTHHDISTVSTRNFNINYIVMWYYNTYINITCLDLTTEVDDKALMGQPVSIISVTDSEEGSM